MRAGSLLQSPWVRVAATAGGSLVGAVVVSALTITSFAVVNPDADLISAFALRIAEPAALVGAVAVTLAGARWSARGMGLAAERLGVITGLCSAVAIAAAAWWTGDVDAWTAATTGLQLAAGIVAGRWALLRDAARTRDGAQVGAPTAAAMLGSPAPELGVVAQREKSTSSK